MDDRAKHGNLRGQTMNRLLLVIPMSITAACATHSPPSDRLASVKVMESAGDELLASGEPAEKFEGIEDADASIVDDIEAVEPPQPHETPAAMIPRFHADEAGVVCTREIPTGSRLAVEVCRERSEIERRQKSDQRLFDQIKTNAAIGTSRL